MIRNAKRKTRKWRSKTIGFHDRNGGPKGHFAEKAVLKPLRSIGREQGVGRVAQNVCLTVVFQRSRGTQNAFWRPPFPDTERDTGLRVAGRPATAAAAAGGRRAGPPPYVGRCPPA